MTGLSRNTVSKWLHDEHEGAPKYRRRAQPGKLTAFHETLQQTLKANARRPMRERRTGQSNIRRVSACRLRRRLFHSDGLRAGAEGARGQAALVNAFVPLAFGRGEAFQFDWSEECLVVGGIYYRLQVSHMKLCASRAFWLVAYPSQGHEMLFDAHARSFAALGRIPRRGIYDNMKTAVDKVKNG